MDTAAAARLLRERLKLPRWAASFSVWEISGSKTIVIRVERRFMHSLPEIPRTFEGHPVIVEQRPLVIAQ